jgi:hypothetical protein
VIGYYVHHRGRGHLHRALEVARVAREPVTVLSSLPPPTRPAGVGWVLLTRDDLGERPVDPTANLRLHWVPSGDPGLCRRMSQISTWLDIVHPRLMVVDVSVEVALLTRLHGVAVASVVLPGRREDPAHLLGFDVADALIGMWPPVATSGMLPTAPADVLRRVRAVGALSRFPVDDERAPRPRSGPRRVTVVLGAGGSDLEEADLEDARRTTRGWRWTVLGPAGWREDPAEALRAADVVVTHAGQNSLAEVAAARRPAVVIPQRRPHAEQHVTAAVLRRAPWPAVVLERVPRGRWGEVLDAAAELDGTAWQTWCDGGAAYRFVDVLAGLGGAVGAAS